MADDARIASYMEAKALWAARFKLQAVAFGEADQLRTGASIEDFRRLSVLGVDRFWLLKSGTGSAVTLPLLPALIRRAIGVEPSKSEPLRTRDSLTGTLDRGELDRMIAALDVDHRVGRSPLSAIFIDVDHFKMINDGHGHPVGDRVLKEVAARIMRVFERKAEVFRYGGEEFVVLLLNYDLAESGAIAERTRRAVEQQRIEGIDVTVSLGVATIGAGTGDIEVLIKAADDAMYQAKRTGRNRVVTATEAKVVTAGTSPPA